MRLLMLTQWFDPEPTLKGLLFAKEMVKRGFDVEVVTGFPNYPGGKVYPGYRIKLFQKEIIDGVSVIRLPLYPSHSRSKIGRVVNYLSYALSILVYGLFFAKRPSVIYAYHPPLTVGISASIISRIRRLPFVYDIQDLWPDTLKATGMVGNRGVLRLVSSFCDFVYGSATAISVLSPGFKKRLVLNGVPEQKLSVIYNWCDEGAISGVKQGQDLPDCLKSGFSVLFAGNIGNAQGLEAVLEAASILEKRQSRARIVFLGDGIALDGLKAVAHKKQMANVHFLPKVSMAEVRSYLEAASALLIHLRGDELFEITIPSKTQAYMAVGKPLLMAVNGDAADLVEWADCGICTQPENPDALADSIEVMSLLSDTELSRMGKNAAAYYQGHLSLKAGSDAFARLFLNVARPA
jgi:colanic acid biosynthesis glycosyl transferase WcaI